MDNCFIFCPGPLEGVPGFLAEGMQEAFLVAVDGGLDHFEHTGLSPHLWVGDGDSLKKSSRKRGTSKAAKKRGRDPYPKIKLARSKKYSDLEFALHLVGRALLDGAWEGDIALVGAQGGRFDHDVGHLMIADRWLREIATAVGPRECPKIYSYGVHGVWIATLNGVEFHQPKGRIFSVFSLDSKNKITITGARYKLRAKLLEHATHGLSNVGLGKGVKVSGGPGPIFVVIPA